MPPAAANCSGGNFKSAWCHFSKYAFSLGVSANFKMRPIHRSCEYCTKRYPSSVRSSLEEVALPLQELEVAEEVRAHHFIGHRSETSANVCCDVLEVPAHGADAKGLFGSRRKRFASRHARAPNVLAQGAAVRTKVKMVDLIQELLRPPNVLLSGALQRVCSNQS